jgi:hypothetical protein
LRDSFPTYKKIGSHLQVVCTGGIYLAILSLLSQSSTLAAGIPLLLIYNLFLILPLVIVLGVVYGGLPLERFSAFHARHKVAYGRPDDRYRGLPPFHCAPVRRDQWSDDDGRRLLNISQINITRVLSCLVAERPDICGAD